MCPNTKFFLILIWTLFAQCKLPKKVASIKLTILASKDALQCHV